MKKNIKIDENYYLISQQVNEGVQVVSPQSTNHIYVVDVSGSMYYDLPLIRKQLKNRLSNIMNDGDTISIIWFSGDNQSGVLKEEVEIKSLKTLTDLHDAIDKWLKPIGLTAFRRPLELVGELIDRVKVNRPNSTYSLLFLTDGYNNNCRWQDVVSELKKLETKVTSSTFVEFGYYADTQKLTEMASILGGEKISCNGFEDYAPLFEKKMSNSLTSTKKISVDIADDYLYDFVFSVDENGSVSLYNVNNGKILIGDGIKTIYFFSGNSVGDDIGMNLKEFDTALYSAVYVLSDKMMNIEAEKLFYALGDNYHYKQLVNAFGKQKLNAFKSSIKECVVDSSKRFPEGRVTIESVPDDTYCLMNLINDLGNIDNCLFYPNLPDFEYNRIGRKRNAAGSELSENDKKRLSEAKNVDEANKILEELKEKNVDLKFVDVNPDKGYPLTDLVWNESRANLSIRVRFEGNVELPKNKYNVDSVKSFKYRTFTIIKDGIVNVDILPVSHSDELEKILVENSVKHTVNFGLFKFINIDLSSLPLINRAMVKSISANDLAKQEWNLITLQADNKVYGHYRKTLFPKESKSYVKDYGQEAADWLKEIGITDFNGFAPKTVAGETTDNYMSVNLFTKIKGLSSLPKVEDVLKKMNENKPLKLSESIMMNSINFVNILLNSEDLKKLNEDEFNKIIENHLITKSTELTKKKREIMQNIAQTKFSIILSKKWFNEFKSFDENMLLITLDSQPLEFTFDLTEKAVDI